MSGRLVGVSDVQLHHETQIREANDAVVRDVALLEVRVIAARAAGMSWAVIARGLNVARQSAMERFGKLPEIMEMDGG